jgi:hypothetical protein
VENIMLTNGTIMRIIFSKLSKPLLVLSSRLNMLREVMNKKTVYSKTILLRRISVITYLIIFFISIFYS